MINSKNYIGQDNQGTYIFQEISDKGLIRGFNGYCHVEMVDGSEGLENVEWMHKKIVNGMTYETGDSPAPTLGVPEEIAGLYEVNTVTCDECGACHDGEPDVYGRADWVIVNECEVYCKTCVKSAMLLIEVTEPSDLFKANDVSSVDLDGYEEIETLFCDSSGFGDLGERALTKKQALLRMTEILGRPGIDTLYAGISDKGQFQVYVTLYRKAA